MDSQHDHTDDADKDDVEPHVNVQLVDILINEPNDEPVVNNRSKCGQKSLTIENGQEVYDACQMFIFLHVYIPNRLFSFFLLYLILQ